ncbi:MAG: alpha-L-fucosidase [Chromatiaceae bacterium]|nr:MAG: alpha-L-fucosidase [Chromatiaceae bacterium]
MSSETPRIPLPPRPLRADGSPRRVGVEIEFSGLSIDEVAALVRTELAGPAGRLVPTGRYEIDVEGDAAGPWRVELDFGLLKSLGRRDREGRDLGATLEALAEDLLRGIAERIVPVEVVSPPLPVERLDAVNRLIARLRAAGARGTLDDPAYAFGMQLNPELPATDTATILHYLQAYLCLEDWLRARARVDWTRRLTFFADPFPRTWVRRSIDPDYAPERDRLIDDYLTANPTRNRALDLLPLFAELDPERVHARISDDRVKARPTLHYRLPNSEIDRPGWDLSQPWADWLVVERLAAAPERLVALCRTYASFLDRPLGGLPLGGLTGDWSATCTEWLQEQGLLE